MLLLSVVLAWRKSKSLRCLLTRETARVTNAVKTRIILHIRPVDRSLCHHECT